jgi:hypothetical protein
MKYIFKILIIALLLSFIWLCYSCDIIKEVTKSKSDNGFKENIETTTFRKGAGTIDISIKGDGANIGYLGVIKLTEHY